MCFPQLTDRAGTSPATEKVSGWPAGVPSLMVLTTSGDVWVVHNGTATNWTPPGGGLMWARWAHDGTLYATTVRASAVEVLHLTSPGHATTVVTLPFTVKADAPVGSCPINGYLTGFALGPEGLVLVRHTAGPWAHSCPAVPQDSPAATDPSRCQSNEVISFDVRTGDLQSAGAGPGSSWGGTLQTQRPVVSDGANTSTVAFKVSSTLEIMRIGGAPPCCFGGQSGTAFALSSDGTRLAYSPDGHAIQLTGVENTQNSGPPLATMDDEVMSLAWTQGWISAAHGSSLSLVSDIAGEQRALMGLHVDPIATMDWSQ